MTQWLFCVLNRDDRMHQLTPAHTSSHPLTPAHTRSHPLTPAHTRLHRLTPGYTSSHQLTPTHTRSYQLTPAHTCSHLLTPAHVRSHQLTPTHTSSHICPQELTPAHTRRSHQLVLGASQHWQSPDHTSHGPPYPASVTHHHLLLQHQATQGIHLLLLAVAAGSWQQRQAAARSPDPAKLSVRCVTRRAARGRTGRRTGQAVCCQSALMTPSRCGQTLQDLLLQLMSPDSICILR
jgi:hypothetical protein